MVDRTKIEELVGIYGSVRIIDAPAESHFCKISTDDCIMPSDLIWYRTAPGTLERTEDDTGNYTLFPASVRTSSPVPCYYRVVDEPRLLMRIEAGEAEVFPRPA